MKTKIILGLLIFLGFVLRIANLNTAPPGFNADEASLGYNAYSILKTGKDEWGQAFPLVFKSFSDYKPGLYVYLDLPFVAVLGLNELAVRLPSILLGTVSILLIYLLSKEIFNEEAVALSTAFLLAISPWHIHYSRGAWETNVATFFILLGIYSFVKSFKNQKWLWLSTTSLIASMYTYQSPRVIVPLLVILLSLRYYKKIFLKKNIKVALFSTLIILPFVLISFTSQGLARFNGLSIFNDPGPGLRTNVERGEHSNPGAPQVLILHNKLISYSTSFLSHYLDHFSPQFLFISGDPLGRNKVPDMGQFYLFEMITILLGIYVFIRKNYPFKSIVTFWILAAPFAAALTYQTPHALRALNMVIPMTLISGLGMGSLISRINQLKSFARSSYFAIGALVVVFFFIRFLDLYFVELPKEYAPDWEYGFSQVMSFVNSHQNEYQKIRITDKYDQAYILTLFYTKYDPATYQASYKESVDTKYGFSTIAQFGKFEFGPVSQNNLNTDQHILVIGSGQELQGVSDSLETINYPNGQTAFKIVGNKGG